MKLRTISYLRELSSQVKKWCVFLLIFFVLTVFIYPSAFIYSQDTLPDNNDTRLIAYIIGQVQKNILEKQPLHYSTYFAPEQNTLAYSDLFLTSAVLTLPFRILTNSPIVILNVAIILGFFLTTITSFILFEYLFKDVWVTTLAVILFNFSGFHLHYLPHLQIFSLWPLCLSLYFFLRFLEENRTVFLIPLFLIVTAQLAESIFPTYLILFTATFLFIHKFGAGALAKNRTDHVHVSRRGSRQRRDVTVTREYGFWRGPNQIITKMFLGSLPFIPLWIFFLFPYYQLHSSLPEATRPIRDAAHFSLGLDQIFTQHHSLTVIIIFIISAAKRWLIGLWFPNKNTDESHEKKWHYIFLFSIIMSLGPVLKIFGQNIRIFGFPIPLPYTLFYYLFPGFTGFRTPSRFIILALLAACILIGFQLKPIFKKLKSKTKLMFILLVLPLLFLEADLPLKGYPVNINMHPVYQQVKALPPKATILELPIKLWNMPDHEIESIRSLYSLEHNHRRLGGFSGFATNRWIKLVENINTNGLNQPTLSELRFLGITHIIQNNTLTPLP